MNPPPEDRAGGRDGDPHRDQDLDRIQPDDAGSPWYASAPEGTSIDLGFVKIDLVGSATERKELPPETVRQQRERYTRGVEDLVRAMHAAWPLHWQGDGVMLFLADEEGTPAAARAFYAARSLWERTRIDLGLPARIAAHAAQVAWIADTGKLAHPAIDQCGHLEQDAPAGVVVLSHAVHRSLPPEIQREIGRLGVHARDGILTYVYPAAAGERVRPGAFDPEAVPDLDESFRSLARKTLGKLPYAGLPSLKREPPLLDVREVFVAPTLRLRGGGRATEEDATVEPGPWVIPDGAEEGAGLDGGPRASPIEGSASSGTGSDPAAGEGRAAETGVHEGRVPSRWGAEEEGPGPSLSLEEAFRAHRSLVVLGPPGSGKSTLVRWLGAVAAGGSSASGVDLGLDEDVVPVPASVGRLAELRKALEGSGGGLSVRDALVETFHELSLASRGDLARYLEARLEAGRALVLLDGLDEVGGADRESVRIWLESFARRFSGNRFVITSREVGFPGFALDGAARGVLEPFDRDQVRRYVEGFTRAYAEWEGRGDEAGPVAETQARDLLEALEESPRLGDLAQNPFILTGLALIHRAEGRLPRHRVQFMEFFARTLCETWSAARRLVPGRIEPDLSYEDEAIPILGRLAREMHEQFPGGRAPGPFVRRVLQEELIRTSRLSDAQAGETVRDFLDRAGKRAQILLEWGPGSWGFLHSTFQEFFVAAGLHSSEAFEEEALSHVLDPRWEEILRLGTGYMALIQKRVVATRRFVESIRTWRAPAPLAWLTDHLQAQVPVAALLAAEAGGALDEVLRQDLTRDVARWLLSHRTPEERCSRIAGELGRTELRSLVAQEVLPGLGAGSVLARVRAALVLGRLRAAEAVGPLLQALRDKDPWVGSSAATALGEMRVIDAVEPLLQAFRDEAPGVRFEAAKALGELKEAVALRLLEALRAHGRGPGVSLAPDPVIQGLLAALDDRYMQTAAAGALWAIGEHLLPLVAP